MREQFKLEPADNLVKINTGEDPYSIIKRWALGNPYEHISTYIGKVGLFTNRRQRKIIRVPMIFESNGRGCNLRLLSERYGEEVVVMRLRSEHDRRRIPYVLEEAVKLASDSQAYYDYLCVVKYAIPRLICEKVGLPMPLKYHRNPWHICSEAGFEIFYRARLTNILPPYCVPPLPGDFVTDSPLLEEAGRVVLSEEVV